MRRASALCFTVLMVFMVFIGAIVLRENLSMTTPEGDVDRQTAEAGDLPAKIQDRAPGAVSVELHLAAPTALVASPLAEIPSSEPQFSQTARASLWSYNGSILQLERAGRIQRFHYGEHRQGSAGKSGDLLFEGVREGPVVSGQAFAFAENCPPLAYPMKGSVNADETSIQMRGKQPRRDGQCNIVGHFDAELRFTAIQYRIMRAQIPARNGWQPAQIDNE